MLQQRMDFAFFFEQSFQLRPVFDHPPTLTLPEDALHLLIAEVGMADQGLEIGAVDIDFSYFGLTY